jgi:hypothetical protein
MDGNSDYSRDVVGTDEDIDDMESTLIKYLELLARIKMQINENEENNLRFSKRNPEFTNSLMLYSKLFRKLEKVGRR